MKKKLFFAVVAIGMLASCAENEYVGEVSPNPKTDGTNAIEFSSGAYAITRADKTGKYPLAVYFQEIFRTSETCRADVHALTI